MTKEDAVREILADDAVKFDSGHDRGQQQIGEVINASGHVQELERNFDLWSVCAVGIVVGNVWAALGGSIVGSPGKLSVVMEFG